MEDPQVHIPSLDQINAVAAFRQLHDAGCFVIPNPWDAGTAIYLQHLGFKALATTSAGLAFSNGKPDTVWSINRDATLANIRNIVMATSLPVNADYQSGFTDDPETLAENVSLCVATGVAGLSIEDASGCESEPLYEKSLAVDRIRAARTAIDQSGVPVVLTARCEAWLLGDATPFDTAVDRLVAYAEAGADCLFAPGVRDRSEIESIVRAVAPKPVNVIVSAAVPGLTVSHLRDLGVRRISVGSALARTAWGAFIRASRNIVENGTFENFSEASTFAELNAVFCANGMEGKR